MSLYKHFIGVIIRRALCIGLLFTLFSEAYAETATCMENGKGLLRLVEADMETPVREEVLKIIAGTDIPEQCKDLLMKSEGGVPYGHIQNNGLRNAAVCMIWVMPQEAHSPSGAALSEAGQTNSSCRINPPNCSGAAEKKTENLLPLATLAETEKAPIHTPDMVAARPDSTAVSAETLHPCSSESREPSCEIPQPESFINGTPANSLSAPVSEDIPFNRSLLPAETHQQNLSAYQSPSITGPAIPESSSGELKEDSHKIGETAKQLESDGMKETAESHPLLALKTNLLFDAALMPNIEIEVPIGKRWSVNGEYMFPWWVTKNNRYCLQILSGGLEGRYWLGSPQRREVLTGHFLGLYAGVGEYDLQWKESGYQGEFFIAAGLSYGWATDIARNLHIELSVGIGLLSTDYRHYHAIDNYQTLLWQENGKYTWFGPTKAKISLVWMLNCKAKKGGVR